MGMKNSIFKIHDEAIKGGYTTGFMFDRLSKADPLGAMEILWCDPNWWQAIGRARNWEGGKIQMCTGCGVALKNNEKPTVDNKHGGKKGCGSDIYEYNGQWLIEWHRFVDYLAEGKSAIDFFDEIFRW